MSRAISPHTNTKIISDKQSELRPYPPYRTQPIQEAPTTVFTLPTRKFVFVTQPPATRPPPTPTAPAAPLPSRPGMVVSYASTIEYDGIRCNSIFISHSLSHLPVRDCAKETMTRPGKQLLISISFVVRVIFIFCNHIGKKSSSTLNIRKRFIKRERLSPIRHDNQPLQSTRRPLTRPSSPWPTLLPSQLSPSSSWTRYVKCVSNEILSLLSFRIYRYRELRVCE